MIPTHPAIHIAFSVPAPKPLTTTERECAEHTLGSSFAEPLDALDPLALAAHLRDEAPTYSTDGHRALNRAARKFEQAARFHHSRDLDAIARSLSL